MSGYRSLIQGFQKRASLAFDESLVSVSVVVKAIAHDLPPGDSGLFKRNLPLELKQLVVESRTRGLPRSAAGDGRAIVDMVSVSLDLANYEAKRRVLAFIDELRAHVGPWDDASYAELLDRVRARVESVLVQAAVA